MNRSENVELMVDKKLGQMNFHYKLFFRLKLAKLIYKTYLTANSKKSINFIKAATKQYIMRQIKAAVEVSHSDFLSLKVWLIV